MNTFDLQTAILEVSLLIAIGCGAFAALMRIFF
jgi:hypothetical protein